MKPNYSNRIVSTIITIQIIIILVNSESQKSGIDLLLQATMDSAWNNSGAFANDAETYLKKLVPPTVEASNEVHSQEKRSKKSDNDNIAEPTSSVFPSIFDKLQGKSTLAEMPWPGNISSSPKTTAQNYLTDLLKPIEESGANIVEGAVKTGVDRAVADISDSFKIDVALVIAVLVIQIILFVCAANLCFYVCKRETEMRSYVKQQISMMNRTP